MSIQNPTKCEVHAVSWFLHMKGETACSVYVKDVMNRQNMAKWCREFEVGRSDVHNDIRSERPSIITDEIIQKD
jgi:hypothetical protein